MNANNKFLNIKSKSKKSQIENEIHEFEDEKSTKIMQLGLYTYDKIRRGLIDENLFGELIYEIRKIDLEIYNRMLDIASIEGHDEHTPICECGYISKNDEKFCPNCGREIKKDKDFILCDVCASKIDSDSKFCICCGTKVVKKQKFDVDEYEIDDSEYEINENKYELDENKYEIEDRKIKETEKYDIKIQDDIPKENIQEEYEIPKEDVEEEFTTQKIELIKNKN